MTIACTLSPADLSARLALIDALVADGVVDRTPTSAGLRVHLRDTPDIERRIRDLVAAESHCCPFLHFTLSREPGALVLDVSGPDDAGPLLERFLAHRS